MKKNNNIILTIIISLFKVDFTITFQPLNETWNKFSHKTIWNFIYNLLYLFFFFLIHRCNVSMFNHARKFKTKVEICKYIIGKDISIWLNDLCRNICVLVSFVYIKVLINLTTSLKLVSLKVELASKPFLLIFTILGWCICSPVRKCFWFQELIS